MVSCGTFGRVGLWCAVVAAGWLVVTAPCVAAAEPEPPSQAPEPEHVEEVERLSEEAATHYRAKEFSKAVAAYVRAYKLNRDGRLLYNIAWIYDQSLSERELALEYYRRYVRAPDAEADLVERALNRIKVIRLAESAPPEPPPMDPKRPDPKAPAKQTSTGLSGQQIGGWALVGTGIASLGVGLAMYGLADSSYSEFQSELNIPKRLSLRDESKEQALIGDILVGVGSAVVVTGIILVATGGSEGSKDSGTVNVGGSWRPEGVFLTLSGSM